MTLLSKTSSLSQREGRWKCSQVRMSSLKASVYAHGGGYVNTSPEKQKKKFLKKSGNPGQDTQNEDNDTGEQTRETTERDDVI